jgi:hypothetical protein
LEEHIKKKFISFSDDKIIKIFIDAYWINEIYLKDWGLEIIDKNEQAEDKG